MSKHVKLTPPTASKRVQADVDAFGQLDELYTRVIGGVDKLLASIEASIDDGTASPALAREAANLVRALNGVSAEQRARQKERRAAFRGLDAVLVTEWARTLSSSELTQLIRQLEGAGRPTKSGLA